MTAVPFADLAWIAPLALADALGAAALGALVLAPFFEVRGRAKGKVLNDKLAQQLAGLGWKALAVFVVLAGAGCAAVAAGAVGLPLRGGVPAELGWSVTVAAVVALASVSAYAAGWKWWRARKGAHLALGWLSALVMLVFAVLACAGAISALAPWSPRMAAFPWPGERLVLLWVCLVGGLALAAAYGPGLGAAYLLWRRTRDDFGRDYYIFGLRTLASVGAAGALISPVLLGAAGWMAWSGRLGLEHGAALLGRPEIFGFWIAAAVLQLAAAALLLRVRATTVPQRRKASIVVVNVCLALGHVALAGGFVPLVLAG
jgi:hypothetical protein